MEEFSLKIHKLKILLKIVTVSSCDHNISRADLQSVMYALQDGVKILSKEFAILEDILRAKNA